ncbi:MAG: glycosyltransferase [Cyclobacteriaceae bacterium]|nr:glycosyltransferase [Cyclobacteriaceae bacterium]
MLPINSSIYLVTLESEPQSVVESEVGHGIKLVPLRYFRFGWRAVISWTLTFPRLWWLVVKHNIRYIHCWCTPAGAIGYWIALLTGRKLIIDSYEPHAESMVEAKVWSPGSLAFRLLFELEKRQTRRALHLISATAGMIQYCKEKYRVQPKSFLVRPACVDTDRFFPRAKEIALVPALAQPGKIVCVYAGKFGGIYQDVEVFHFFRVAVDYWGDRFRVLILSTHNSSEVRAWCNEVGIDTNIVHLQAVVPEEMPRWLSLADFALTPVKPIPTKRYCTPIKDGEYWAMGLPVVIPDQISDDSEIIFKNRAGYVLKSLTQAEYLAAVEQIDCLLRLPRADRQQKIRQLAFTYRSYEIARGVYHAVYGKALTVT